MAEDEVTVSIEKVAHDQMAMLAQSLLDKYGLRVDRVSFEWLNASIAVETRYACIGVALDSYSRPASNT